MGLESNRQKPLSTIPEIKNNNPVVVKRSEGSSGLAGTRKSIKLFSSRFEPHVFKENEAEIRDLKEQPRLRNAN